MKIEREKCLQDVVRHDILNKLAIIIPSAEIVSSELSDERNKERALELLLLAVEIRDILRGKNSFTGETQKKGLVKDVQELIQFLLGMSQVLYLKTRPNDIVSNIYHCCQRIRDIESAVKACSKILSLKDFVLSEVVERESRFMGIDILMGGSNLSFRADCMFARVVGNLLQNALRHGKATVMSVFVEKRGDDIVIVFQDNGKGVPKENKEKIFEYGFTTKIEEPGGEGLGFCRDILDLSGATIEETGIPEKGARFEITVPKEDIINIMIS